MKELRIGLVLYGGVSLAVYMSGIITEIWNVLRATQPNREHKDAGTTPAVAFSDRPVEAADCYWELIAELERQYGAPRIQVVVDAVAGTSAGGLGGAALAKAVVEGADLRVLNETWIEDADISSLKSKPGAMPVWAWAGLAALSAVAFVGRVGAALWRWWTRFHTATLQVLKRQPNLVVSLVARLVGALQWSSRLIGSPLRALEARPAIGLGWLYRIAYTAATTQDGRVTPLDGRYFTRMIARSFAKMSRNPAPPLLPLRGTFDLFLTSTDLFGWPRHLPVSPELHSTTLYEHTHAHVMQFNYRPWGTGPGGPLNDFALTFASRSTAGFPVAFAPVCYADIAADFRDARDEEPPSLDDFSKWHLSEHRLIQFPVDATWMVDGGILDNKPFSYVTKAIEEKPAEHEVYRAVLYIEPDPEPRPAEQGGRRMARPRVSQLARPLFRLIRHEPIMSDLRDLDLRNARVRQLQSMREANRETAVLMVKTIATEHKLQWPPAVAQLDNWRKLTNEAVARQQLTAYPGYVAHKARCAAQEFSDLVCRGLDYPYHSRQGFLVRNLVRCWLDRQGALAPPSFKAAAPGGAKGKPRAEAAGKVGYELNPSQRRLLDGFDLRFRLRRIRAVVQAVNQAYGSESGDGRGQIDACKATLSDIVFDLEGVFQTPEMKQHIRDALAAIDADSLVDRPQFDGEDSIKALAGELDSEIRAAYDPIVEKLSRAGAVQNQRLVGALKKLPPGALDTATVELLVFPFDDLALFPLMDMAGVSDLINVRTMRVSPSDAEFLSSDPKRLKGWALAGFEGFLDRRHREWDLLWGRLDGAERLIQLIIAAAVPRDAGGPHLDALRDKYTCKVLQAIVDGVARTGGASDEVITEVLEMLERKQSQCAGDAAAPVRRDLPISA